MNSYELSRNWFDWSFENPELVNPNHTAIYFFAIEHCNRLGWKEKFGFPTQMVMDALGIKKHQTYIKYFNELVDYGFIKMIQKSKNQYSANIISLMTATPKNGKALDKAIINHGAKQTQTNGQSNSSIDKQINNITTNQITSLDLEIFEAEIIEYSFTDFWEVYPNKTNKKLAEVKFNKLTKEQKDLVEYHLPLFVANKPFKEYNYPHATTYLSQERYKDEITTNLKTQENERLKQISTMLRSDGSAKYL
jgi:hypothetical protein